MGKTFKQMRDDVRKAKKRDERNPKLTIGNYKLLITNARMIKDDDSKELPANDPDIRYQGVGFTFKVLESQGSEALKEGMLADKAFWTEGQSWQKDRNFQVLRAFIEGVTGEDIDDFDEFEDLVGWVVYNQVSPGKNPDYPKDSWAHIPQTVDEVLANRAELATNAR